ncbi:hypothetical protein KP78_29910 [Jeotgalibacillus soli]|uniref:Uncharacterized protein n=1 Tax=Jeotgalibacillus soli TaxID=889306 RepID=A0A0C2V8Z7_9BACL|nr:hypothetical protein KP78_29910 [Jeotgalibacillus soli]
MDGVKIVLKRRFFSPLLVYNKSNKKRSEKINGQSFIN